MFARWMPREERFFELFVEHAEQLVLGASELKALMQDVGELTVRKRNIFGVVLALIGAVFIVTYAPDSQKQLTMELLETYMMEPSLIAFIICNIPSATFTKR